MPELPLPKNAMTPADLLPTDQFVSRRQQLQTEVMAHKQARRISLGPAMTLLFENRVTMLWQVQEMCRVEGITRTDAVQHELDTYNAMLPRQADLSATLLIDYRDEAVRDEMLPKLLGLHHHMHLELPGVSPAAAVFDTEQFNDVRISSVQFIRIPLTPAQVAALGDLSQPAALVVDHPHYQARALLSGATRGALSDDLRDV